MIYKMFNLTTKKTEEPYQARLQLNDNGVPDSNMLFQASDRTH